MKIKTLGKKQTTVIVVAVFFLAGLAGSLWYRNLKSKGGLGVPGAGKEQMASLRLTSNKNSVRQGDEFTVSLTLDSGSVGVDAADFVVDFDPQFVKVEKVTEGEFFKTYPINKTDAGSVRVSGVAFFDGKNIIVPKGKGVVAKVNFIALDKPGDSQILVNRDKTIVAVGGKNILDTDKVYDFELRIK